MMGGEHDAGDVAGVVPGDGVWEDPRPRPARDAVPVLSVAGFEGPLDWLLEMARAQKIDLARLPIVALIDAFATALETALAGQHRTAPLGLWGDWLVMATTLTLLRSRLLLPADPADARAAEDEADRLRRQLLDRSVVAAAADWLEHRPQLLRDVFARGQITRTLPERAGDITALLRACLALITLPEGSEPYRAPPPPVWRVTDAIARITQWLADVPEGGCPLSLFEPAIDAALPDAAFRQRVATASTFLAGLELARDGRIALDQSKAWEPVLLHHQPSGAGRQATA
ncbi:segregation/condensation protein A [Acidisoma cellulosilytica]|uniref:Segregation and condensation protein A n=1 Tax=Acidisoma cellulosilyticum TaxID=2802395 RepID=A0A964E6T6_9PROT|nr:segregation/condensation protein A [Acidisoma cellulosilyticum]MCB8883919.1 segregation/condensation protein A [Acidisoma cellulosilyticum]